MGRAWEFIYLSCPLEFINKFIIILGPCLLNMLKFKYKFNNDINNLKRENIPFNV